MLLQPLQPLQHEQEPHRCSRRHPWPQATRRQRKRRPTRRRRNNHRRRRRRRAARPMDATAPPGSLERYAVVNTRDTVVCCAPNKVCVVYVRPDHDCLADGRKIVEITFADRLASAPDTVNAARRGEPSAK